MANPNRPGPKPLSKRGYTPGKRMSGERAKILSPFARWLKAIRVRSTWRGEPLTQWLLSHATGISQYQIAKYERDEMMPVLEHIPVLAAFFDVDAAELYTMTYNLPPDMYLFLTTTREGVQVVKNIEVIMRKVKAEGGPHPRPDIPEGMEILENDNAASSRINHFSRLDLAGSLQLAPKRAVSTFIGGQSTQRLVRINRSPGSANKTSPDNQESD